MSKNPSKLKILTNGILNENPVLRLVLGTCPTLATSTMASNGIGMGLAATFVLVCSNIAISALRKIIPDKVRLPAYITVIATFVTVLQMLVKAFVPALDSALGIFLPLIAVNCAIMGGSLFMQQKVDGGELTSLWQTIVYGLGSGLGWWLAIVMMAAIREKTTYSHIPAALKGPGIAFIITGLMGIAFMIFSGIQF